jgi:hypothetical protein
MGLEKLSIIVKDRHKSLFSSHFTLYLNTYIFFRFLENYLGYYIIVISNNLISSMRFQMCIYHNTFVPNEMII